MSNKNLLEKTHKIFPTKEIESKEWSILTCNEDKRLNMDHFLNLCRLEWGKRILF
jgi:hypothetical protein